MVNNFITRIKRKLDSFNCSFSNIEDLKESHKFIENLKYEFKVLEEQSVFVSKKNYLLNEAKNSPFNVFRLITTCNDSICIFQFCEDEFNFVGMCSDNTLKVEYTIDELPNVIDKAEKWISYCYKNNMSGYPYLSSGMHLIGIR